MKGTKIILSGEPQGKFLEGVVSGTPKPGTVMELKNTVLKGGEPTWQVWSKASGAYGLIAVLMEDTAQGSIYSTAYVDGTRCRLYCPIAGEKLNMLVHDVAGTADDVAIGALFGVETATGKLIANSSYARACFTAMEVITDPVADYWMFSMFNG